MSISTVLGVGNNAPPTGGPGGSPAPAARQNQRSNIDTQPSGGGIRSLPTAQVTPANVGAPTTDRLMTETPQERQASAAELERAMLELQRRISVMAPKFEFSVDNESGRSIIKVTDPATKEVIRQIPSEQVLRLNEALDQFQGLLLNRKA